MIGWFLLLWTGATLVWIPLHNRFTSYMTYIDIICFVGGLLFVGIGYYVAWKTPDEIELDEKAHDLRNASEDGCDQHDGFAVDSGPGKYPTHRAA
jgi:hypothetical protein